MLWVNYAKDKKNEILKMQEKLTLIKELQKK